MVENNSKLDANKKQEENLYGLFILFGVVFLIWAISIIPLMYIYPNLPERGTFGDSFGLVNSLFSGLALAGIIYTIFLQKKELKLQREELHETREEFKIQNETLRQQRFENTLFQLISIHHELIDKLSYRKYSGIEGGVLLEKREVIRESVDYLQNCLVFVLRDKMITNSYGEQVYTYISITNIDVAYQYMVSGYNKFYFDKFNQMLSHYYRNIYHIFKFIFTSKLIQNNQKKFYSSIVRAQLSSDELFLIFYNCLIYGLGNPNFLFLIKEFDLMQNFDFELISKNKFHKEIFDEKLSTVMPEFDKE